MSLDWERIEALVGQALELAPTERDAFLEASCGDDGALRREVESLLKAHDAASPSFLGQPLATSAGWLQAPPPTAGEHVGPYRLLERLGEGGMGTVYLAERADGAFDRQVAVKVLRRGMESEAAALRFEQERRILAGLDHPGIARLFDGGTTPAGAPFVVLELIEGEPIDRYCDQNRLSVARRLDLVRDVCDAVAMAHRSLVVHRDLKPSNVLVDREGRPKLLDFGIAKILDPDPPTQAAGSHTATGGAPTAEWQRLLTPNYASPEQVRGERVTVATDVYLLGILLYKLLTGQVPHRFANRSLAEVEAVLTGPPPTAPSRLAQTLPSAGSEKVLPAGVATIDPDLDHIVLKALRVDPADRYASVDALADDLRHFRQGFPVEARSGSWRYRARKLVRRQWRGLTAAAVGLVLLTTFAVDRAIQVGERERALARAEASLARSEALRGFVEGLFWNANPSAAKGEPLTVVEALDRGEARLDRGEVGPADLQASVYALLGRIRYDLGEMGPAQENLAQAVELFASVEQPEEPLRAAALRARGDLGLATLQQLDRVEQPGAEAVIAAAIDTARQAYDESRFLAAADPLLALELSDPLAEIYCILERWPEAAPLTVEAMELVAQAGEVDSPAVAVALGRRALILRHLEGDFRGAAALYGRALEIYARLEGTVHPEVANLQNQRALIAEDLGDLEGAVTTHQIALATRRQLYSGGAHPEIGQSLEHLGRLHRKLGNPEAAVPFYDELVEINTVLEGPFHGRTVYRSLRLAEAQVEAGQTSDAESLLRTQLDAEHRAARPAGSRLIVWAEGLLGVALLDQGDASGAELLQQSVETLRAKPEAYETRLAWLESHQARLRPLS